jgi:hypothetical protein
MYGYSNPVNHTDPSGHLPCTSTYYSPDCTYIPVQPTIVSRQAWGAHEPGSYGIQNNPLISEGLFSAENPEGYMTYSGNLSAIYNKITIHHEGDDQTYNVLAVQEAEMNSGFYDIGYHFIIGQDGTIYEGRNINVRGNHAYPNTGNIGILWLGDFVPGYDISDPLGRYGQIDPQDDVNGPTLPQYFATIALTSWLNYKYGIDNLYGHRELNSTACPGDYAMPYIDFLKDFAR